MSNGWTLTACSPGTTTAGSEVAGFEASHLADIERVDSPWQSNGGSAADTYLTTDHGDNSAETSGIALLGGYWPPSGLRARIRRLNASDPVSLIDSSVALTNYGAGDVTNITIDPTDPGVFAAVATPTVDTNPASMDVDLDAWSADAATGDRQQQIWIALRRKSGTYVETTTGPTISIAVWDGVSLWVDLLVTAWIPSEGLYSVRFDAAISTDILSGNQLRIRLSTDPGSGDAMEVGGVSIVGDVGAHEYDSGWINASAATPRLVADDEVLDSVQLDERPSTSILHAFQDVNGTAIRVAARYTRMELDPLLFYSAGEWIDATTSIHWQRAIDGEPTASNQVWTLYLEGPGVSGPGPSQFSNTPSKGPTIARTIDASPWTVRQVEPRKVEMSVVDLSTDTFVEVVEVFERVGTTHPVVFHLSMLSEDGDRAYSLAGYISGPNVTTRTGCRGSSPLADVHDVRFTLTEIGSR